MSLQLITNDEGTTALYDTVSEWAFGPVFTSRENADAFLDWAEIQGVKDGDVRRLPYEELSELSDRYFELGGPR
jgi:hypothetical protein